MSYNYVCIKHLLVAQQDTGNGVQSADVVLYGLGLVIPLMNAELLKVCNLLCMHVCMYIRTYVVCMYIRTYIVCMYVRTYVCTHVRTYVCMYVRTYVRMYVCMYIYTVTTR